MLVMIIIIVIVFVVFIEVLVGSSCSILWIIELLYFSLEKVFRRLIFPQTSISSCHFLWIFEKFQRSVTSLECHFMLYKVSNMGHCSCGVVGWWASWGAFIVRHDSRIDDPAWLVTSWSLAERSLRDLPKHRCIIRSAHFPLIEKWISTCWNLMDWNRFLFAPELLINGSRWLDGCLGGWNRGWDDVWPLASSFTILIVKIASAAWFLGQAQVLHLSMLIALIIGSCSVKIVKLFDLIGDVSGGFILFFMLLIHEGVLELLKIDLLGGRGASSCRWELEKFGLVTSVGSRGWIFAEV